jgi:hypothetical protein
MAQSGIPKDTDEESLDDKKSLLNNVLLGRIYL